MRICETCERHYYACELCRTAKEIDAPITICMKCAPSLRIIKPVLERKDLEIRDLLFKLRRYEAEASSNEELRRQLTSVKKQNEDFRVKLRRNTDEMSTMKVTTEKAKDDFNNLTTELRPKNQLVRDMKALHLSQDHSDCTITCRGVKFPAHKCILCARSEPLKRMLNPHLYPAEQTSPRPDAKGAAKGGAKTQAPKQTQAKAPSKDGKNKEAVTNVELNDVAVEFMPYLMNYIYTGETEHGIDDKTVHEMLRIAKKLGLNGLGDACLQYLGTRINKNSVVPTLITAYEYKNDPLKRKCLDYIERNDIDLVKTPQWQAFKQENPKLALELYERYSHERSSSPKLTRKLLGITSHDVSHLNTDSLNSAGTSRTPRPQDSNALRLLESAIRQDPSVIRAQDPSPYRTQDPSSYRPQDPPNFKPLDSSGYRPMDPSGYKPMDPSGYKPLDPSGYKPLDPSSYKPIDSNFKPTDPNFKPLDPSTYRSNDPSAYRPQDPSALRPQDPTIQQGLNWASNNLPPPNASMKPYAETPMRVNN